MRRPLVSLAALVAASGCSSQSGPVATESDSRAPASVQDAGAGPDVTPTAAPGVAFRYDYAFRLAADRVAEVQERHARACEELGVQRCRVTGMQYRLVDDRHVEASLALALEPSIARRFGQIGIEAVREAEGVLISSEITGTDVGTGAARDARGIDELNADLRRVEAQLAGGNARDQGRAALQAEAERLRADIRAAQASVATARDQLAATPMTFSYGSGSYGSNRPDFAEALSSGWSGFLWAGYGLLVVVLTLLPWLLALLLILLAVKAVRRRWPRRDRAPYPEVALGS